MTFSLPRATREDLYVARFSDIDAALRFAAVELDLSFSAAHIHWGSGSDGEIRHFTQFLVWASSALVGIDEGVRKPGNQALISRWGELGRHPLRVQFKGLRDEALKERVDAAPWQVEVADHKVSMFRTLKDQPRGVSPRDAAVDYLLWIRDKALPLLFEAIALGSQGSAEPPDAEIPMGQQIRFWDRDPWTSDADPELQALKRESKPSHGNSNSS